MEKTEKCLEIINHIISFPGIFNLAKWMEMSLNYQWMKGIIKDLQEVYYNNQEELPECSFIIFEYYVYHIKDWRLYFFF